MQIDGWFLGREIGEKTVPNVPNVPDMSFIFYMYDTRDRI